MHICIDLGGTNLRGTWVDQSGNCGELVYLSRPQSLDGTKQTLMSLIRSLISQAPQKPQGIGLASAGPLDHIQGKYLKTSNIPELDYFQVSDFLHSEFGLPVRMENDAQAAALGEVWKGGLAGESQAVILTLGTGLGSGVIMQGKIWRAGHFTGPELGHIFLGLQQGRKCGCGQPGCAEVWLNKQALLDLAAQKGYSLKDLRELQFILDRNETMGKAIMQEYGVRLGLYLSILQVVFGFKSLGLSGGLSAYFPYCQEYVWSCLQQRFKYRQWWLPERIVPSPDPELSAILGMARVFKIEQGQDGYGNC
ncbi:MAG: ROK family protein [Desulfohalobiaceae bacterium]